jgi:hypothetical protein
MTSRDARKQALLGFGVGSFITGFSIVTAGVGAILMATKGVNPWNAGMMLTAGGAATFFGGGAINAWRALIAATVDDLSIITDFKIYARSLEDEVTKLHLRLSMKVPQEEGEKTAGDRVQSPAVTRFKPRKH